MELEDEEEKKRAGASKIERRNLMMTLTKRTRGKRENEETAEDKLEIDKYEGINRRLNYIAFL